MRRTFAAIVLTAIAFTLAPAALAATTSTTSARPAAVPTVEYRLPFEPGQAYRVTQGWHGSYSHTGLSAYAYDFALPEGTRVLAAASGVVAFVQQGNHACGGSSLRDKANYVTINHVDGTATTYVHLSSVSVRVGQVVTGGQLIGLSGRVGFTNCEAHLHFARQAQGKAATQSQPIYFAEYGHHEIRTGTLAISQNPSCAQTGAAMPTDAFCGIYTSVTDLGPLVTTDLDPAIDIETLATAGAPSTPGSLAPNSSSVDAAATARDPSASSAISGTWIGRFSFAGAGLYMFDLASVGDVRVSIDGALVLSLRGSGGTSSEETFPRWLTAGRHVIRVEYRSGAVPLLRLTWRAGPEDTTNHAF